MRLSSPARIPVGCAMRHHVHDVRRATGSVYEPADPHRREYEATVLINLETRHHRGNQDTNIHC